MVIIQQCSFDKNYVRVSRESKGNSKIMRKIEKVYPAAGGEGGGDGGGGDGDGEGGGESGGGESGGGGEDGGWEGGGEGGGDATGVGFGVTGVMLPPAKGVLVGVGLTTGFCVAGGVTVGTVVGTSGAPGAFGDGVGFKTGDGVTTGVEVEFVVVVAGGVTGAFGGEDTIMGGATGTPAALTVMMSMKQSKQPLYY